jgi:putative transposase
MPGDHPSSGAPLSLSRGNSEMIAAADRTVFAQPDAEHVHSPARRHRRHARAADIRRLTMFRDAATTFSPFTGFPVSHWKKI